MAASSFVWAWFHVDDKSDAVAECLICKKGIRRGCEGKGPKSFSTTPLHTHMKIHHHEEYQVHKAKEESKLMLPSTSSDQPKQKKMVAMKKQLSLQDSLTSKKIWDINDSRSRAIHKKIINMMALDNQPFSMVEDDGFIDLLAHLQPHYMLPSRRYFTDKMLPETYKELRTIVQDELAEPNGYYISFTSDIWTCSTSKETFISMSGHWVKKDFKRVDAVLCGSHFPGSHTGINISEMFQNMWDDWDIHEDRRNLLVRDGAANMSLGGDLAHINSIHCTVHRLQLVIQDSIFSQRSIIDLLAKCRRLATHFNHSALACTELKSLQEQGTTPLLLVQDVPTRWNSAYLMVERVVRLKRPIQLYLSDHNNLPTITANEWQISERLLHILKPFFDLTKEMSGEYSVLSDVIPNIVTLELFLSKIGCDDRGVQSTREALLRALRTRFLSHEALNVMHKKEYVTATCIDPRYKDHFLRSADDKQQAKAWLVEELLLVHEKFHAESEDDINDQDSQLPPDSPQRKRSKEDDLFSSCFMEIATQQQADTASTERQPGGRIRLQDVAKEVDPFLSLPLINRKSDPLEWWRSATQFPLMQELARKLLCTPSSSVFSERMYSEYGNIFEEKRSRLLPKNGEKLLFIHHNGKKFLH